MDAELILSNDTLERRELLAMYDTFSYNEILIHDDSFHSPELLNVIDTFLHNEILMPTWLILLWRDA